MTDTGTILFIDDEVNVLRALDRVFIDDDYEILTAGSGEDGLVVLKENPDIKVVVSDYRMPGLNGVEFLRAVCQIRPDTVRIVLSGYADTEAVVSAINEGQIFRFVPKPWNDEELRATIANAIELYDFRSRNRELIDLHLQLNNELQAHSKSLERTIIHRTAELNLNTKALEHTAKILGWLPVGILVIVADEILVRLNDAAETMLGGRDRKPLLGEKADAALPPVLCEFYRTVTGATRPIAQRLLLAGLPVQAWGRTVVEDDNQAVILTITPLMDHSEADRV